MARSKGRFCGAGGFDEFLRADPGAVAVHPARAGAGVIGDGVACAVRQPDARGQQQPGVFIGRAFNGLAFVDQVAPALGFKHRGVARGHAQGFGQALLGLLQGLAQAAGTERGRGAGEQHGVSQQG
jgi:hypothetical protein